MKKLLFVLLISSALRGMQKQIVINGKLRAVTRYAYFDEDDKTEKSIDIIEDTDLDSMAKELIVKEEKIKKISSSSKNKKSICKLCNKSFSSETSLLRHLYVIHEKKKEKKCDKCDYIVGDGTSLKFHKFKEHGEGIKYTCTQQNCGKSFFTPTLLGVHARVHKEEKPFSCQFCEASFKQKCNRKRHENFYCKENNMVKKIKK